MKVLHVIDSLCIGGAERVFLDITKLLADKGLEVGILLFYQGSPLQGEIDKKIKVHILNRQKKYSLKKMYEANSICSEYDIVHVHMRYCYTYIRLSQILFRGKYKLICHDHFGDIELNSTVPQGMKYIFKPRYYIGVSSSLVNWALNNAAIKKENVFLLRNTIIPDSRINYLPPENSHKAFITANLRRTKNIEFAFELSSAADINITVYGNRGDDAYYKEISDLMETNKKVDIIEGVSDFSNIYSQYALAIHCARSESGPLVLMEYLAYGIPFIAYKTGEVAHTIYYDLPLHFMDNFEVEEWVQRICELKKQNGFAEIFKKIFEKYFSPGKYINDCLKIYSSILNGD
jgi:glycosyltransferase involved in cell wall biosynthesis